MSSFKSNENIQKEEDGPCENKMQLCVKAAEKPAFPQLFCVFLRKLQIFLDLRKTCVFYKTAAEKLRLFLWIVEKLLI